MTYPIFNLTPRYAKAASKKFKLPPEDSLRRMPPSVAGATRTHGKVLMPGWIPLDEEDPKGHLEAASKLREEVLKKEVKTKKSDAIKTYPVPGKDYVVSEVNGSYSCTCKGFIFRRKCRHIREIKESLNG